MAPAKGTLHCSLEIHFCIKIPFMACVVIFPPIFWAARESSPCSLTCGERELWKPRSLGHYETQERVRLRFRSTSGPVSLQTLYVNPKKRNLEEDLYPGMGDKGSFGDVVVRPRVTVTSVFACAHQHSCHCFLMVMLLPEATSAS